MATISNLYIDQGTNFSSVINVSNDDGSAFDLTSYTVKAQIRKTYTSSTAINFTTSIPGAGQLQIALDDSVTAGIKAGRYVYDVVISNTDLSNTLRISEGILTINPGVSR
jgi:hypothetical protein